MFFLLFLFSTVFFLEKLIETEYMAAYSSTRQSSRMLFFGVGIMKWMVLV